MKHLLLTLMIAGVCFSVDPDAGPRTHSGSQSGGCTDAWTITITSVNDVAVSGGSQLRGLDFLDNYGFVLSTDYEMDSVQSINPGTGAFEGGIPTPAAIPDPMGIAYFDDAGATNYIYINDWRIILDIYYFDTGAQDWFFAFGNPSPEPRGMDFDPNWDLWEIDAVSHKLYHFDLAGSLIDQFTLSEPPSGDYACGCSVQEYNGDLVIAIGGYYFTDFYFYLYDGSTLEFMGSAPEPFAASTSYGLSYGAATGLYYWLYSDGNYRLCTFECDIVETALEQTTWGDIKSIF